MLRKLRMWAKQLKRKVFVLYYACKDPHTPWYAKLLAVCVVAYACSPVDLIPDFIPVLGMLDDVILVPLGVWLALRLMPVDVIQASTLQAEASLQQRRPRNWLVGSLILLVWLAGLLWLTLTLVRYVK